MPPAYAPWPLIKSSSRYGKTPTPRSRSSNRPKLNTRNRSKPFANACEDPVTPDCQRGGHAKRFSRAFDTDTKKWVLLASLSGCIMRASFPRSRYPNNFSCVIFRKEKDREFPRSSRLESYQHN